MQKEKRIVTFRELMWEPVSTQPEKKGQRWKHSKRPGPRVCLNFQGRHSSERPKKMNCEKFEFCTGLAGSKHRIRGLAGNKAGFGSSIFY